MLHVSKRCKKALWNQPIRTSGCFGSVFTKYEDEQIKKAPSAILYLFETCKTLLYRVLIFLFSLTHVSTGDCYRFRAVDSESAVRWREAVREAMRPKSKDLMKFEWWVINDESPQSHEAQDGPIYITCHKTTVISLFLFLTKRRIPRKQLPKMSHSLDDSWIMSHYYESWPGCLPFPNLVRQIYLFMF